MLLNFLVRPAMTIGALLAVTMPAHAANAVQARLVHCGTDTCLRISGHRSHPARAIQVAGQELAVAGGRNWRVTVPLASARAWGAPSGETLPITLLDAGDDIASVENVLLPPGALGRRVELATLIVSAR